MYSIFSIYLYILIIVQMLCMYIYISMVSILGIVILSLGIYSVFVYMDPSGSGWLLLLII